MKYLNIVKEKLSALWPMWFSIMLVAIWSVFIQDGSINRDGIIYLKQANLFIEGDWENGLLVFNWPLFSILIAFLHKATNIHLHWVAHVIDLALFGIATYFYLKTLQLIIKQKHIIFYAGLLLLSFIPIMDDYIGMILRDPGLWAGCMAGTFFYFKYINHNFAFKYYFLCLFSFLIAGAFRPEGLVFLIAILLFNIYFIKLNYTKKIFFKFILNLFLFLILICLFFIITKNSPTQSIERFWEFKLRIVLFFKQFLSPLPIFTDNHYLNLLIQNNPIIITSAILGSLFFMKIIKGLGVLNLILIYKHFRKGPKVSKQYLLLLYFFITISLSLVFTELYNHFVLTDRYFIMTYFWILIILSPVLHSFFELDSCVENKFLKPLIIILIVIFLLNVLIDKRHYSIEMEAGKFLKTLHINEEVTLINADRIAFYADISLKQIWESSSDYSEFKDWVVFYTKDKLNFFKPLGYDTFKSFEHKDQAVFIYKKVNSNK